MFGSRRSSRALQDKTARALALSLKRGLVASAEPQESGSSGIFAVLPLGHGALFLGLGCKGGRGCRLPGELVSPRAAEDAPLVSRLPGNRSQGFVGFGAQRENQS